MKTIEFKPNYSVMRVTLDMIAGAINAELSTKLPGYFGAKVNVRKGDILAIDVCFRPESNSVTPNKLASFGIQVEKKYSISDEVKEILKDFLDLTKPITTEETAGKPGYISIYLEPIKTMSAVMTPCQEGYEYAVLRIFAPEKYKGAYIEYAQMSSEELKAITIAANNAKNNNRNRNNNNPNQNRNNNNPNQNRNNNNQNRNNNPNRDNNRNSYYNNNR